MEIIEFRRVECAFCGGGFSPDDVLLVDVCKRCISSQKLKWISVEDRLPDKYTWVLTWDRVSVEKDFFSELGFPFDDITHWMPLPLPPESEDK